MVEDEGEQLSRRAQIVGLFVVTNAGIGSIGLLSTALRGQFLGSIFVLVAATVTLLTGPIVACICGVWAGPSAKNPRTLGAQTAAGYVGGGLVAIGLLSLGGDLPLSQLGGGLLLFALPTGFVGAGVSYLVR